ncbi:hypothetical protein AB0K60_22270 [Thermopolyspora sp. NPDC052614]|uniref:hypothetical protein n=1 Tax=Thermopolyspora sp. NPDC052614 TaxID=3155682 RepID=UPI0034339989
MTNQTTPGPRAGGRLKVAAAALLAPIMLAVPFVLLAGCGIEPTDVIDEGPAPVIRARSTLTTVYLLRDDRLAPKNIVVASGSVEDTVKALFQAGERSHDGVTTALTGLRLEQTYVTRYDVKAGGRNGPDNPLGLRLHVIVNGSAKLTETAKAQITCTAMLRQEIWAVKLTHTTPDGPVAAGEHTCREYWPLAAKDVQLPP